MAECNGYFGPHGKYFSTKNLDLCMCTASNFRYQQVQMKCAWQMFSRKLWLAQFLLQLWTSFKAHNFAWKIILMRFLTNETLRHHQSPGFFNRKMYFRPQANNQKIHMKKNWFWKMKLTSVRSPCIWALTLLKSLFLPQLSASGKWEKLGTIQWNWLSLHKVWFLQDLIQWRV